LGAPGEQPTRPVRELRPHSETNNIVLVIRGPIARASIASLCQRVHALLEGRDADHVVCDVSALVDPDAVTVDALARMQLTARRLGHEVRLRHACGELEDLIALMGLRDVVARCVESAVEPRWQTEQREQAFGVEEEGDPADPTR
jgi:ABC-type transporter Mla MlaB component